MNILDAYPDCREAVAFCEMSDTDDGDSRGTIFDMIRKDNLPLDDVLLYFKGFEEDIRPGELNPKIIAKIRQQMEHPSFRTYLAAKLGML